MPEGVEAAGAAGSLGSAREHAGVFLDRDGVINRRSPTFVRNADQLEVLPGVPEAIARLTEAGFKIAIVTNQRPVAWGWIDEEDLMAIHAAIEDEIEAAGGRVDIFQACTHGYFANCGCGKPEPGLLKRAGAVLDLDPERCWMVGDKASDVEAGRRYGARTIWVTGEHYPWERWRSAPEADAEVGDLPAAVEHILTVTRGEQAAMGS